MGLDHKEFPVRHLCETASGLLDSAGEDLVGSCTVGKQHACIGVPLPAQTGSRPADSSTSTTVGSCIGEAKHRRIFAFRWLGRQWSLRAEKSIYAVSAMGAPWRFELIGLAAREVARLHGAFGAERWLMAVCAVAGFGLAGVIVLSLACTASAATDPGLVWAAPVLVEHGAVPYGGIQALACPDVSLCVGFDAAGKLVTSTTPTVAGSWRTARIPGAAGLVPGDVSCPSVSLCVALAASAHGAARILISTSPATGPAAWRIERLGVTAYPTAISCASSALCVGVGGGDVVTSSLQRTREAGASPMWTAGRSASSR